MNITEINRDITPKPDLAQADPFDPGIFRVKDTTQCPGTLKALTSCRAGKPPKDGFVRANPDPEYTLHASIIELKESNETYLLAPDTMQYFPTLAKVVDLTVAIDRQGNPFLWMTVPKPSGGADNQWWATMRMARQIAEKNWVRVESNMRAGGYDCHIAQGVTTEPVWPDHTLSDYLCVAFGGGRVIDSMDHPVAKQLMGYF